MAPEQLAGGPVTEQTEWYGEPALVLSLLAAGLLGWGLYAALSGRPLRWEGLLES